MSCLDDLRAIAATRNYSVAHIAEKSGLSAKTITSILNGTQDDPRCKSVEAIADALGCQFVCRTGGEDYVEAKADVAYYRRLLQEKTDQLATKDKWIFRLFITSLVLIGVNILTMLYMR